MKLSQAIRLGAMLKPQAFGVMTDADHKTSCALWAALEAAGYPGHRITAEPTISSNGRSIEMIGPGREVLTIPPHWLWLQERKFVCPVCGDPDWGAHIIGEHLNDAHRWTREEVSEWVETIEPAVCGCGCGCEMEPSVRAINGEQV